MFGIYNLIGGQIGGAIGGVIDTTEALTKRQKEVLKLIAANPSITYNEIAEALGINESAVGKHITAIKNKGFFNASRRYTRLLGNQSR